ncbi:hypothetical protein Ancab_007476 [Ancistrocladus abbreviatus]
MTQKEDNVSTSTDSWSSVIEAVSILHQLELSNVALKALMNLKDKIAKPHQLIGTKLELFVEIAQVLRDQISYAASKAVLKLHIELNPWWKNRIRAVNARMVMVLVEMLLQTSERRSCELALNALDQLCGCAEGRAELLKHWGGLAIVSKKILRVSNGRRTEIKQSWFCEKKQGNGGAMMKCLGSLKVPAYGSEENLGQVLDGVTCNHVWVTDSLFYFLSSPFMSLPKMIQLERFRGSYHSDMSMVNISGGAFCLLQIQS